jgi:hypothetical protein
MTEQVAPQQEANAKPKRVSGEARYPNFDLENCLAFAKAIKEQGGNSCTAEQLGGLLGYKNVRGGGFISRVAAARQFRLITTVDSRYRITDLAETILYPVTAEARQRAVRDAFLGVQLYERVFEEFKGKRLPEALGLDNFLRTRFQIPAGDRITLARRVMLDSASQAGFFTATKGQRTHLVDPVIGTSAFPPVESQPENKFVSGNGGHGSRSGGGGNEGGGGDGPDLANVHFMLRGLLSDLPPRGEDWPGRDAWEAAWSSAMDYLYGKRPKSG